MRYDEEINFPGDLQLLSGCRSRPTLPVVPVRPYADCGINLLYCNVTGTIHRRTEAQQNAFPWLVFIYSYHKRDLGPDMMNLDLPQACKTDTTDPKAPAGQGRFVKVH